MKMQRLRLDFVQPAYSPLPGLALLLAAIVLMALAQFEVSGLSRSEKDLQDSLAKISQKPRAKGERQPQSDEFKRENQSAHDVASLLLLPWRDLFAALEIAASDDVTLLSIEPDHRKQQVRITAEAKDFKAIVDYMKRLGEAPQLEMVHLEHYQQQEDSTEHGLRFSLLASWKLGS